MLERTLQIIIPGFRFILHKYKRHTGISLIRAGVIYWYCCRQTIQLINGMRCIWSGDYEFRFVYVLL